MSGAGKKRKAMAKKKQGKSEAPRTKLICDNRQARFRYEILDKVEAGLMLMGSEVKACRLGRAHLTDSYARFKNGEIWLIGAHIGPYPPAGREQHEPERPRKLLLKAAEVQKLSVKMKEGGITVVPLRLYFSAKGLAKAELGLARGKKIHDKRSVIAERESKIAMDRAKKNAR